MGEMKVEHVLLFLVGAFLVYHMMGKCRRIEGLVVGASPKCLGDAQAGWDEQCADFGQDQKDMTKAKTQKWCGENYYKYGFINNYQCNGTPVSTKNSVTGEPMWLCTEGKRCADP